MQTVILKLGEACNLNCSYCSQEHFRKTEKEGKEISPSLLSFLDNLAGKGVLIKFYGGEPLLYYPQIKQIINRYKENFNYMMISNGTLLKKEMVELFNKYRVRFLLSHDGLSTIHTKGKDVLKSKRFLKLFDALEHKEFISVVSSYNQRIDWLYDWFRWKGYSENRVSPVFLVNNGTEKQKTLSQIDMDNYRTGIQTIIFRHELYQRGLNDEYKRESSYVECWLNILLKNKNHKTKCSSCGYFSGMEKIIVDTQGNVYDCQNQDNIIGKINEPIHLGEKKIKVDCSSCPYESFCEKVCPNMTEEGQKLWCSFYKVNFEEILKYVAQKGEELYGKV